MIYDWMPLIEIFFIYNFTIVTRYSIYVIQNFLHAHSHVTGMFIRYVYSFILEVLLGSFDFSILYITKGILIFLSIAANDTSIFLIGYINSAYIKIRHNIIT